MPFLKPGYLRFHNIEFKIKFRDVSHKTRGLFEEKSADFRVPALSTIHNLVNKFRRAGSVQGEKRKRRAVLTEEILDDIGHPLARKFPQKYLRRISHKRKILHLHIRGYVVT
ncbi:hypothetical protein ANN_04218 [Periplaneta americana]|uniref:DUF4817 domain-containing protein n=1 Tax=Periplaneta americana TaxID=6978 RepID=A0ABQ8T7Z3_PERAM|nr:hypothetical protein ANN_04218 [Periplaneta americana]